MPDEPDFSGTADEWMIERRAVNVVIMKRVSDTRIRRRGAFRAVALIVVVLVAAVALVALWKRGGGNAGTDTPRHVILISLDTTRADHLGCYDNTWIQTPRLDALAAESIVLTDFMTVASTTLASHASLMTGKHPHTHGVPRNGFVVNDQNATLAEILRDAGFTTAAFVAAFALDRRFNLDQGFDHYDQRFEILGNPQAGFQNERRARSVTDAVIEHLDREGVPERLFLFVHYFDAHQPYDPPQPYDGMYGVGPGATRMENHPALADGRAPPEFKDYLRQYAGEVSYMDEHIGRLLDDLRRRGVLDQALLAVTSDHGELLRPRQFAPPLDHGWTTYQAEMHAVGLLRLPDARRGGTRLDLPTANIDVTPTILSLLNLPAPADVDGETIDLRELGGITQDRTRFGEATKPRTAEREGFWYNNLKPRCVRQDRFKYVSTPFRGTEELYDLSADPYERVNLLVSATDDTRARADRMRGLLDAWTASQNPLPARFDDSDPDDTIQRLKSLGYLGGDDEEDEDEDEDEDTPP